MIYLFWYLEICAGSMLLWLIYLKIAERKSSKTSQFVKRNFPVEEKRPWNRILIDVLGNTLAILLFLPFWPVLVFFEMKMRFFEKGNCSSSNEPGFSVTPKHACGIRVLLIPMKKPYWRQPSTSMKKVVVTPLR